jgi:hypothetical protein
MIHPGPGEHAVLLLRGHIAGIIRFLTSRVPLHPNYVPSIGTQLIKAIRRAGAVSYGGMSNESVVLLTGDQIAKLHEIVRHRFNRHPPEETAAMLKALQTGLDLGTQPKASSSPSPPTPSTPSLPAHQQATGT